MAHVLITGCSSGFGLLAARTLAAYGDQVTATARKPAEAAALQALAAEAGIHVLALDVTDAASVAACIAAAEAIAPIDVLVNNAGVELRGPIEETSDADARWQFETNVFGVLNMLRGVVPLMRGRGRGVIVNVSSVSGLVARPYTGLYSASKFAVEAITESLHYEVQPYGIRVALVEPGQFATSLHANMRKAFAPDSPYAERSARFDTAILKLNPTGERGNPQDVADAILHAIHGEATKLRHLVGQDAKMAAGAKRQMEFEVFEQTIRAVLDWHD
ncbi:SDR family oxidoreductase [Zavarzinia sp. CC-PAN008]|uniref:SDR family oxidoreductase n=1 Tax=Zavarzinia sp. CC-PAN008 TaxID=3243332 RepID=UPI003F7496B1